MQSDYDGLRYEIRMYHMGNPSVTRPILEITHTAVALSFVREWNTQADDNNEWFRVMLTPLPTPANSDTKNS